MKMKWIVFMLMFSSVTVFGANTEETDEAMQSVALREQVCDSIYFGFFDYGEMFDGDYDGFEFNSFCADQDITVTHKTTDRFPKGMTPAGLSDVITTKLEFTFDGPAEKCTGAALRTLPASGFRVDDDGVIKAISVTEMGWSIDIYDCY